MTNERLNEVLSDIYTHCKKKYKERTVWRINTRKGFNFTYNPEDNSLTYFSGNDDMFTVYWTKRDDLRCCYMSDEVVSQFVRDVCKELGLGTIRTA